MKLYVLLNQTDTEFPRLFSIEYFILSLWLLDLLKGPHQDISKCNNTCEAEL